MDERRPPIEETLLAVFHDGRRSLAGFFLRGAGDRATAEDLLQDTFLQVWDRRRELAAAGADRAALQRYLWRAARNRMIDEIRGRQRLRGREASAAAEPQAAVAGPHARLEWEDCLRVVRETVARLPNLQARRCLQLWLRGLGAGDIADRLGLAPGRVRGLLQRGRAEVVLRAADRLGAPPGRRS